MLGSRSFGLWKRVAVAIVLHQHRLIVGVGSAPSMSLQKGVDVGFTNVESFGTYHNVLLYLHIFAIQCLFGFQTSTGEGAR